MVMTTTITTIIVQVIVTITTMDTILVGTTMVVVVIIRAIQPFLLEHVRIQQVSQLHFFPHSHHVGADLFQAIEVGDLPMIHYIVTR